MSDKLLSNIDLQHIQSLCAEVKRQHRRRNKAFFVDSDNGFQCETWDDTAKRLATVLSNLAIETNELRTRIDIQTNMLDQLYTIISEYNELMVFDQPRVARDNKTLVGTVNVERLKDVLDERRALRTQLKQAGE